MMDSNLDSMPGCQLIDRQPASHTLAKQAGIASLETADGGHQRYPGLWRAITTSPVDHHSGASLLVGHERFLLSARFDKPKALRATGVRYGPRMWSISTSTLVIKYSKSFDPDS
jgi:hypothetical protein